METVALAVRTPFPWRRLLQYLSHRMVPVAERIEGDTYIRQWCGDEVTVRYDDASEQLEIRCASENRAEAMRRVTALFAVAHEPARIDAHLSRSQPLDRIISVCPGLRPLGTWSAFELCCRTILGQQVTVAAANTLMRRLIERCGGLSPAAILAADLAKLGMPGARVKTLQTFASAVLEKQVDLESAWSSLDAALAELPGFGPWTRTYLAIRLGRETDAFPATDVGLLRASGASSTAQLLRLAEGWRPFRAYAAAYLWMHA